MDKKKKDVHHNAPAGGGGPGFFRSAAPLGTNHSIDKWQQPGPRGTNTIPQRARLYFAIYYYDKDNAFKRAAETWAANIRASTQTNVADKFMFFLVETESTFNQCWMEVAMQAKNYDLQRGAIFTHSSKDDQPDNDGLEFKPGKDDDGTLNKAEITRLPTLTWGTGAQLELMGCNTGMSVQRGWCPAAIFAKSQKVPTTGQAGYAYFSTNANSYSEINATSTTVYLWAYRRRRNGWLGDGARIPGITYKP